MIDSKLVIDDTQFDCTFTFVYKFFVSYSSHVCLSLNTFIFPVLIKFKFKNKYLLSTISRQSRKKDREKKIERIVLYCIAL